MTATFKINVLVYGSWTTWKQSTPLSQEFPRDHIHIALTELYLYSNNFEHIKDVEVVVESWEEAEDEEGNGMKYDEKTEQKYSWSDSDKSDFRDFHGDILLKKTFNF